MLTQAQRIEISKKIISIPKEIETAQTSINSIQAEIVKAQNVDTANKTIFDLRTPVVNGYQLELTQLDGNQRTEITETLIQNGAKRTIGNVFFYNQVGVATPSNPDGIWKSFTPFLLGYGIGKNYFETFPIVTKEQDLIDAFDAAVAALEVFHPMERCTGQHAIVNPSPPPLDLIEDFPDVQDALDDLIAAVQAYETFLIAESGYVYTSDYDATRLSQSLTAKNNIDNIIRPAIDLWQSYNDYNTAHGQTTIAGFYSYDTTLLQPTKGNPIQLGVLKTAVSARKTFIDTVRAPQLVSYLGTVTQSVPDGEVTSYSGLYGEIALGLNLRLSATTGSLTKLNGLQLGLAANENIINSLELNEEGYDLLMKATKLKAPATNTNVIHVFDPTGFNIGDTVYVCADNQVEYAGEITAISGNRIDLDFTVPQKYTTNNNSRFYKEV